MEVAKATTKVVSKVATKTSTASRNNDKNIKQHVVYKLVDGRKQAQYVGRTKDVPRTIARHKANPYRKHLNFEIIRENLNVSGQQKDVLKPSKMRCKIKTSKF